MITAIAYTTHQKGTWKWEDRYQSVLYTPRQTKSGKWVWKSTQVLNDKLAMRHLPAGVKVGSIHNAPLRPNELALLALGVETRVR